MKNSKTKPAGPNDADRLEFSDLLGTSSVRKHLQAQDFSPACPG
jgi:hypothetical protein